MHHITVHVDHVHCSCGFYMNDLDTKTARTLATEHGDKNRPSIVVDLTNVEKLEQHGIVVCSEACLNNVHRAETADANWHHITCPNHSSACCYGRTQPGNGWHINHALRASYQHTGLTVDSL